MRNALMGLAPVGHSPLLFVGGPWHSSVHFIPDGVATWRVPVPRPPTVGRLANPSYAESNFDVWTYARTRIWISQDAHAEVFMVGSVNQTTGLAMVLMAAFDQIGLPMETRPM